ncbi:isochorismatase [Alkalilimnicola ehrlichii]|uniref:Isochorismatase n=1 Tax=Alkalilimnicola ehrlichii TaxID=351052 RepID=A0A3E0WZI2_9GAMM|nr:isochorismatase family cysteine hydrolase [Alkalilimnicola ehrlichii]RFA28431.1 isochorismatase [Alkalilimnicola ehrlichii]RFA38497.1 isochorismatase [Alkalilimnicola ehrlichii]
MSNGHDKANQDSLPLGSRVGQQWLVDSDAADLSRVPRPVRRLKLAAEPKSLYLDANKCALLIVDMQNDFCTPGGWLDHIGVDVTPAQRPIQPLQKLLPVLRRAAVPVLWVNWGNRPDRLNLSPALQHVYKPDASAVGLGEPLPNKASRVLEEGSWGAAIVDELLPAASDIHIRKYRMSGFWDTELDSVLRNLGVSSCLVAGVNADQCVLHTLADANFLGYDTVLLEDCTATTSPAYCWDATIYNARQIFGFTALSTDLIQAIEQLEE